MTNAELREQVAIESEAMRLQLNEVKLLIAELKDRAPTAVEKAAAGAFLGQLYGGLENILKRFCRQLAIDLPDGPQWHRELLELFSEGTNPVRPCLFTDETALAIDEYRRFRHLFVHGYSVTLDWSRLQPLLESAPETFEAFLRKVEVASQGQ